MAARLLLMFSVLILEIGCAIAVLVGIANTNGYAPLETPAIIGCVLTVAFTLVILLVTIALFVRGRGASRARSIIADARSDAARILSDATEKALALCSLDGPRCPKCGNPRTGKFCPKCGSPGNLDLPTPATPRHQDLASIGH